MTRKRLNRDKKWFFQGYPYYQMRMENELFKGLVSVIQLTDGEYLYWEYPRAGKVAVAGKGMVWLQLIPDGCKRAITAKFLPDKRVSVWYVDVIESLEYDDDGVAAFIDKYLDVIFTPQGDVVVDDRDELDHAFSVGELTEEQYKAASDEGDAIYGVTPWDEEIASRTEEIEVYLEEHPEISRYVILDDCYGDDYSSNPEIKSHLVYIDALKGLQDSDLLKASEIMNRVNCR